MDFLIGYRDKQRDNLGRKRIKNDGRLHDPARSPAWDGRTNDRAISIIKFCEGWPKGGKPLCILPLTMRRNSHLRVSGENNSSIATLCGARCCSTEYRQRASKAARFLVIP